MLYKKSFAEQCFDIGNILLMCLLVVVTLYPLLHVAFASVSNPADIMAHTGLLLKPLGLNLAAYEHVFQNPNVVRGYMNTAFIVTVGVTFNLFLTSLGAYFLSRKNVLWKKPVMILIVITMFFEGGLIPFYFTVKQLGLDNTLWALIIPVGINTYNLIIMRTAFMAVPDELIESVTIDGGGHFTILFRIVLPLSMATVAVMILYYGVYHWNAWFNAMIFLRKRELFPLQLILREILILQQTDDMTLDLDAGDHQMIGETIRYALIMVATVPILCLYPMVQRYFVKGVMIGALKG